MVHQGPQAMGGHGWLGAPRGDVPRGTSCHMAPQWVPLTGPKVVGSKDEWWHLGHGCPLVVDLGKAWTTTQRGPSKPMAGVGRAPYFTKRLPRGAPPPMGPIQAHTRPLGLGGLRVLSKFYKTQSAFGP